MAIKCILLCKSMKQRVEINLSEYPMNMSSVDFSKCTAVFEDGNYEIYFSSDQHKKSDIESVEVCVNREKIGHIILNSETAIVEGCIKYKEGIFAGQPFLLHYDLVDLSFILSYADGSSEEYFSDLLLCMSKNQEDETNIKKILQELIAFDDSEIGEWIFSDAEQDISNSFYEGKWNKHAYKSLTSYIQLLENVISCYKNNYLYFKMQAKHTIKQSNTLVSYEKVKTISRNSFDWIVQNTDQLVNVPYSSGIQYQMKNYLPYRIKTDASKKSWDVYENRIVINFLYTVLSNAKQIYKEFNEDVLNENRVISTMNGGFPDGYQASIITVKSLQVSFCKNLLEELNYSIDIIQNVYKQYIEIFDICPSPLTVLPRKTSTFCEIRPYIQVFEIIVRWFQYGEYSLEKERLILQVKTLDKLFEYYCLLRLLKLLADNGYKKAEIEKPVFKYKYTSEDSYYHNEKDVANTYILSCDNIVATLYYQPVISASRFENNITLYRTTKPYYNKPDYYTPDFVLKFSSAEHNEEYVIFDAKFSSRENIKRNSLFDVIRKYSIELGVTAGSCAPKMVWILQGRVNSFENAIWKYHNSPLASMYRPVTSYGIVSINTTTEINQRFWNEIQKNVLIINKGRIK